MDTMQGVERLASVVTRGRGRLSSIVGPDAGLWGDLQELSLVDPWEMTHGGMTVREWRVKLRRLAALLPDLPVSRLSQTLFDVLAPRFYSRSDILVVLSGRRLADSSIPTSEPDIRLLQEAGRMLQAGRSRADVVRVTGLGGWTVDELDEWLGLSDAHDLGLLDDAVAALEDGWSVRRFASERGLSHGTAGRLMQRARRVLAEVAS